MKNLLIIITFLSFPLSLLAKKATGVRISPIVGFERVLKVAPTAHFKTRAILGARAVWGPSMLSVEAEVTRASDTESYAERSLSIKEESYAAKLGLRSSYSFGKMFNWFLRAGGHARKTKREITRSGVTTVEEPAIRISPYAGTGFKINLAGNLFANGGITAIFTGKPKGSDREYQSTLGVGVRF